jgi:two-component system, cell cycle sensor histidine kinase and response regulator CckA
MLQQTFPKVITFNALVENRVPDINADPTQIHQALLNLCVNARDAMPNGGEITIHIEMVSGEIVRNQFPTAKELWYESVSVKDTGLGMDDTTRNQIFDPFFTTKEKGKGTGLGLSVVYGIIQAHHGFVEVASFPDEGTIFTLYFPVPHESTEKLEEQTKGEEESLSGNETILVVEDEVLLLDMIHILLETHGYKVLTAVDGQEAVDLYKEHVSEIALVLTDMGLPKLTGMDEFEKLKAINPNVKLIFASGYIEPEMKTQLIQTGAKDFLQKPYVLTEVLTKIRKALEPE